MWFLGPSDKKGNWKTKQCARTSRQSLQANHANSELILADSQGNKIPLEPVIGICITRAPVIGELFVVELEDRRKTQEASYYMYVQSLGRQYNAQTNLQHQRAYSITMAQISENGKSLICFSSDWDKVSNTIISMEVFKRSAQIGKQSIATAQAITPLPTEPKGQNAESNHNLWISINLSEHPSSLTQCIAVHVSV